MSVCVLEIPRLCLLVMMLGVASYHDTRTREIPDYVWIAGCCAGAVLYVLDWQEVDSFAVFSIAVGGLAALLAWRVLPVGEADVLAILASCVVCPVSFGMMNPVIIFLGGLVLEHMAAFFYNVRYNVGDLCRRRLFAGVVAPWHVRAAAFYSVHRRRPHERFTFCAEKQEQGRMGRVRRRISLSTPDPDSGYETRTGVFVTWAMPAFPFMLAALLLAAAAGILFL